MRSITLALVLFGLTLFGSSAWAALPSNIPADNPAALAGYLDVTLYKNVTGKSGCKGSVDPTGKADSWCALQQALDDGEKYGMAVYLPPGTYLVTRQLYEVSSKCGGWSDALIFVGATQPTRPKIVLADHASGFGDATKPLAVVKFIHIDGSNQDPEEGDAPCGMYMAMRSFDVSMGTGNSGAIGLQNASAQYSFIEDVSIDATGAYAGARDIPSTNGMNNVSVTGGQYGIIADTCCGITLAGITLTGQTVASVWATTWGTLGVVGFDIAPANGASALLTAALGDPQTNLVSLVDGSITMPAGSTAPVIANLNAQSSLHVQNVAVNATSFVLNGKTPVTLPGGWQVVDEYAYASQVASLMSGDAGKDVVAASVIDGVVGPTMPLAAHAVAAPPTDYVARHSWSPSAIPSFDDAGVANVMTYGAKGDGTTDDSDAIQKALDASDVVFLPKGDYLLGKPVTMHAHSKLFGVPGGRSWIIPRWNPGTTFDHAIDTDAVPSSDAYLGDLTFEIPAALAQTYIGAVHWRFGRNSLVRQLAIWQNGEDVAWKPNQPTYGRKVIEIDGGGGRWYGLAVDGSYARCTPTAGEPATYRALYITQTSEPSSFYGLNIEHNMDKCHGTGAEMEVASAANVRVLTTKSETGALLIAGQSKNVMATGITDNGNGTLVSFTDCEDVIASNVAPFAGDNGSQVGPVVKEVYESATFGVPTTKTCNVLSRGTFDPSPFVLSSYGTPATSTSACDGDARCAACTGGSCASDGGTAETGLPSDGGSGVEKGHAGCSIAAPAAARDVMSALFVLLAIAARMLLGARQRCGSRIG